MKPEISTAPSRPPGPMTLLQGRQLVLRRLLKPEGRDVVIAMVDQTVVSGVNCMTALILARSLEQTSYGYYVLLFALLLFSNGIQNALITAPLMTIAPRYSGEANQRYLCSLWLIQLGACAVAGGIVAVGLLPAYAYWPVIAADLPLVPVVLVVVTYLAQEFIRRLLFSQHDRLGGLLVDCLSYGLQLAAIVGLSIQQWVSLGLVLWVIGLTSLASCVCGLLRCRPLLQRVTRDDVRRTWAEHWSFGGWLMSSALANWSATQLYLFIVAAMLSPAATAVLAASRNLLGFSHVFLLAWENFVPSTLSRRLMAGGIATMQRWLLRFRLLSALVMGLFCLVVTVFADPLMHLLYGPQYSATAQIVALTALSYFINAIVRPLMIGLRTVGLTNWIFQAQLAAALCTVVVAIPLVAWAGIWGAASGMVLTQLILLLVATVRYRQVVRFAIYEPRTA